MAIDDTVVYQDVSSGGGGYCAVRADGVAVDCEIPARTWDDDAPVLAYGATNMFKYVSVAADVDGGACVWYEDETVYCWGSAW